MKSKWQVCGIFLLRGVVILYTRITPVDQAVPELWVAADWEYCEDVTADLLVLVFFPRCLGKNVHLCAILGALCFYSLELCYSWDVEYNVDFVF